MIYQKLKLALLNRFRGDDGAVTAIEYALIAGLIAVVITGSLHSLGTDITNTFTKVSSEL